MQKSKTWIVLRVYKPVEDLGNIYQNSDMKRRPNKVKSHRLAFVQNDT